VLAWLVGAVLLAWFGWLPGVRPTLGAMVLVGAWSLGMAIYTGLWARWVTLIEHREPATALALFRIAIGLCTVWTVGHVMGRGVLVDLWVDEAYGGYRHLDGRGTWLVELLGGHTPAVMWALAWGSVVGGLLMVAGVGGRLVALVTLQCVLATTDANAHAGGSYDELLSNGLWLAVLAKGDTTLSLSCRLRTGSWVSDAQVAAWPRYLMIFQIVFCYWTTGLQKVSAYWMPGGDFSALYYILQQPTWQRFDNHWAAYVFPLTQVGTAVTWSWEVLAPLWLLAFWFRATRTRGGRLRAFSNAQDLRRAFALVGLGMHITIALLMDVGPFSPISLAFYTALWHPDEYAALARRLRRRPTAPRGSLAA
jgi:hypothetical protein